MNKEHQSYGAVVLGLIVVVLSLYLVLKNRLGVSLNYDAIYTPLGIATLVLAVLFYVVDFTGFAGRSAGAVRSFFLSEPDDNRFLSSVWWWGVVASFLFGLIIVFMIVSNGLSFYAVPNAFSSTLSYSQGLGVVSASSLFLSSVIPGLFEEFIIFSLISGLSLVFTALTALLLRDQDVLDSLGVRWFWIVVFAFVGAFVFMAAHAQFVGDGTMSLWSLVFEFSVQMLNQLSGGFVSWIPHMMHNAAVVVTNSFSLAPLGALGVV